MGVVREGGEGRLFFWFEGCGDELFKGDEVFAEFDDCRVEVFVFYFVFSEAKISFADGLVEEVDYVAAEFESEGEEGGLGEGFVGCE